MITAYFTGKGYYTLVRLAHMYPLVIEGLSYDQCIVFADSCEEDLLVVSGYGEKTYWGKQECHLQAMAFGESRASPPPGK